MCFLQVCDLVLSGLSSLAIYVILFRRANRFSKFGRGHYEKFVSETILNLDQWFKRIILSSGCHSGQWSEQFMQLR